MRTVFCVRQALLGLMMNIQTSIFGFKFEFNRLFLFLIYFVNCITENVKLNTFFSQH